MKSDQSGNITGNKVSRRKVLGSLGIMAGSTLLAQSATVTSASQLPAGQDEVIGKTFHSLVQATKSKSFQAGEIIRTMGYSAPGDGGAAVYRVESHTPAVEPNGGDIIGLDNGNVALLTGVTSVNYKMFGATGDLQSDDGVQIKMAHDFANRNHLPVIVHSGTYRIEATRNIDIRTSVQWGETVFLINEAFNGKDPVFRISGYEAPADILSDTVAKEALIRDLRPGVQQIPELKSYSNCLLWIRDNNDRIGHRYGEAYKGQSRGREELIYIEEDGRIVGDVAWTFTGITDLIAYPAERSYLTVDGGSFHLSGDSPSEGRGYRHNGILITRSRTIVRNQWVGLAAGKSDISLNPRSGFYYFTNVFDTCLENIRLIPYEYDRPGTDKDGHSGTYGIGGNRMLETTFRNITAEGTRMHWGVFGTNMNKNFRVENCRLNRIDVHFHCWNLSIRDSLIGHKGITITGGGDLTIENTVCDNNRFVNFRSDFGGKWFGNIFIKNCRMRAVSPSETSVLFFVAANFDYGYPIGMAKSIYIDNFVFDYNTVPDSRSTGWIIRSSTFSVTSDGKRSFFPSRIILKNIFTDGREKGLRIMRIADPKGFQLNVQGSAGDSLFEANSHFLFENIQLEKITSAEDAGYHFQIETDDHSAAYDVYSLYPQIRVSHCPAFSAGIGSAAVDMVIDHCIVNRMNATPGQPSPGEFSFTGCKFVPVVPGDHTKPYDLSANLGTSFVNCTFHLPVRNGEVVPSDLSLIDFLTVNGQVRYNHVNSRLGKDLVSYLKQNNIRVKPSFLEKLKTHHELED